MSDDTNSDWTTIQHGRNDVLNDSEITPNLSMCVQSGLSFIQIKSKVQEDNIYANWAHVNLGSPLMNCFAKGRMMTDITIILL